MKFLKYEFDPKQWDKLKSEIQISFLGLDDKKSIGYNHELIESVVEIGHIMTKPPVLDEEMNMINPPVISDKYSVDILWKDQELPSFESFKIWCEPIGIHSFGASIDADYIEAFNEQNIK
jgi:hypothetical protein